MLSRRTMLVGGAVLASALAARALRPTLHTSTSAPPLDKLVPKELGPWHMLPDPRIQVSLSTGGDTSRDQPYDDQIARTYIDGQGHELMLAVAYGARQRQEVKIHRPELCYPAQGWRILSLQPTSFDVASPSSPITGHQMLATNDVQDEAVSYWIRIGSTYSSSPWRTRWVIMQEGLAGHMTDGVLVRFSERLAHGALPQDAYARQAEFARLLIQSIRPEFRGLLAR